MSIYWLASYPKSGNTWFCLFVYNFLLDCGEPADINDLRLGCFANDRAWINETLGFDISELSEDEVEQLRPEVYRWSSQANAINYRRIHDANSYLPDGQHLICREATLGAIYIVRNPLDVAISFACHLNVSIDKVIERMAQPSMGFLSTNRWLPSNVRQRVLSWSANVASWVDADDLNVEIIRYEDMKTAPLTTFTRAIDFLGLPVDRERIEKAIRFSEFEELKSQEAKNGFKQRHIKASSFFRKGQIGDWRNALSDSQVNRIIADHRAISCCASVISTSMTGR